MKISKAIFAFVCAAVLCTLMCVAVSATKIQTKTFTYELGDANGDKSVSGSDMLLLRLHLACTEPEIVLAATDINGDERLTAKDSLLLRKAISEGYDLGTVDVTVVVPPLVTPFTTVNEGESDLYIIPEAKLNYVRSIAEDDDIIAVDYRHNGDPNVKIISSYKISDVAQRSEIIDALLEYNAEHPLERPWTRTKESMLEEWRCHNLAYSLGIKVEQARDVDLNNADEGKTMLDFLSA